MQPRHFENLANLERQVIKQQFQKVVNPPTLPFGPEPLRDKARLAKKGKPRKAWSAPAGISKEKTNQDYQKNEIAKSIFYCRKNLGLGLR